MSALDKIRRGKRLTADFLYELLYGIANGDYATTNNNLPYWRNKDFYDHVIEGCLWTGDNYGVNRNASMSAGIVMINGKIVTVDAVANRTFTASKDTYVDVDEGGAITYTEVANNAASPTLADSSIRLAIVVTGASTIANQYSINQGRLANNTNNLYLPNTGAVWQSPGSSTIVDGDGNRIYPTDPQNVLVSAFSRAASATTGSPGGTSVAWNGMNYLIFQAEPYTNYVFTMTEPALSGMTNNDNMVFEIYLAAAANTYTTTLNEQGVLRTSTINTGAFVQIPFNSGGYSGKTFLNIKFRNVGFTGTCTMNTGTTRTGIYTIEKK